MLNANYAIDQKAVVSVAAWCLVGFFRVSFNYSLPHRAAFSTLQISLLLLQGSRNEVIRSQCRSTRSS